MKKVIKKPLISEKNNVLAEKLGVYTFEVSSEATKLEIRSAVEKSFKVKVSSVRTMNCRGRSKRNRFGMGSVSHWKKAFVRLIPGDKIAIFEGA